MSDVEYTIWVDGLAYCGDSDTREQAPALSGGWYDRGPETVNGINIGGVQPHRIAGRRNLISHLDRITRRIGANGFSPRQIIIQAEEGVTT